MSLERRGNAKNVGAMGSDAKKKGVGRIIAVFISFRSNNSNCNNNNNKNNNNNNNISNSIINSNNNSNNMKCNRRINFVFACVYSQTA
uniref:Uncharacterized protein n=1 Tax=Octopus bimaculoides TaxID=37653 RepID=A0A0L8FZJ9_OCTBM